MDAYNDYVMYDYESEQAVLGSIILDPELIKDCPLAIDEFSPGRNSNMYWLFLDMDEKGIVIDPVNIASRVKTLDKLDAIGGIGYISQIAISVHSTLNFKTYCNNVREFSKRRRTIAAAETLKNNALEGESLDAIKEGLNTLMDLEDDDFDNDDGDITDALKEIYESFESETGQGAGSKAGYPDLDRIHTFQEEDLIIVAARPSVGKTAFALNIADKLATPLDKEREGEVNIIFSLETKKVKLLKRLISIKGHIDSHVMRNAKQNFTDEDWKKSSLSIGALERMPIKIFDRFSVDLNYIWSKVRKVQKMFPGKKVNVFIDYLQLIQGDPKLSGNRTEQVGQTSRGLKKMARELKVCVIALAQLSRSVEQRQDKRPILSDLRESGNIEQDADIIDFLYRESYYDKETENQNMIEIIVAKNRDGGTGTVSLAFIKEYQKFVAINWGNHGGQENKSN